MADARSVVHLELHTPDRAGACGLYAELCGWRAESVRAGSASYLSLELGDLSGGIVECGTGRPVWVPYVEVRQIDEITARAQRLGASVLLEPREGATGWRSVVATAEGGEIAFWQPRERGGR